jgi:DnaK suppressor protein
MLERMAELEREISAMEDSARPVEPDNAIGRLTRLEAMGAQGVSDAALRSMKAELGRLRYAAEKVESPDFGECVVCGEDIPVKRLMVKPDAATCVRCAERGER